MICLNCKKYIDMWQKTNLAFPESSLFCDSQCEEQWAYTASDIQIEEIHKVCERIKAVENSEETL